MPETSTNQLEFPEKQLEDTVSTNESTQVSVLRELKATMNECFLHGNKINELKVLTTNLLNYLALHCFHTLWGRKISVQRMRHQWKERNRKPN
jgi:hypothetical protein